MLIKDAVDYVTDRFVYSADSKMWGDSWRVMPLNNEEFKGDCDDFAITCFWYVSKQNLFVFLLHLLITHKYALYRCKTVNNEWHIVGRLGDLWFDNWSLKAMPKAEFFDYTLHTVHMRYVSPIIALFLLIGLFKK